MISKRTPRLSHFLSFGIFATLLAACGGGASPDATPQATQLAADVTIAAVGQNLYVAPNGSDANPGTQTAPVLTIARADALASAGAVIHVAPGTYRVSAPSAGSNGIVTSKSGTASARIKFVSDVKWGAKIIVSGTGITWHSRGSYVDIEGFDISGTGRHGILAAGANLTINNNFIHDMTISGGCTGGGGAAIDTYGPVGNVVINANVVRNIGYAMIGSCNTVQGIYIANANNIVTNNLVSGVAAVGIQQWHGATASTIVNNTTFHNKIGILIGQGDSGTTTGSANNYVANNIVHDNRSYGIVEGGKVGGNNRYVNNLVYASGTNWRVAGAVSGAMSANPLFLNYLINGTGNYRLQSSSPAIGTGTTAYVLAADIDGVSRAGSRADLGAYKYGAAVPPPAGANLYVAPTGVDSNPGTAAYPFLTIARADAAATAGTTINVAPGIYRVSAMTSSASGIVTTKSGTVAARIKFLSTVKGGAKIVVQGTGIAWNSRGDYVDISGFDMSGTGRIGLLANGAHLSIKNNLIHDLTSSGGCGSGGAAIRVDSSVGDTLVSQNVVRNIGVAMLGACTSIHGIHIGGPGAVVSNNIISGAAAIGIHQSLAATSSTIVNNTVFHSKIGIWMGADATLPGGSQNNVVANNIVHDHMTYGIIEAGAMGGNNKYVNNLVNASGTPLRVAGAVSGTVTADPRFVNYQASGSGDYHLQSTSPAMNRGSPLYAPATNVDGNVRDATPDIGAY
jgi:hypothetical protein